jgi:hypothetical protein
MPESLNNFKTKMCGAVKLYPSAPIRAGGKTIREAPRSPGLLRKRSPMRPGGFDAILMKPLYFLNIFLQNCSWMRFVLWKEMIHTYQGLCNDWP